jgi:hypothetical protein
MQTCSTPQDLPALVLNKVDVLWQYAIALPLANGYMNFKSAVVILSPWFGELLTARP